MKYCLLSFLEVFQSLTLRGVHLSYGQGGKKTTKKVIYSDLCWQLFPRNSPHNSQKERDFYQQITSEEQTDGSSLHFGGR